MVVEGIVASGLDEHETHVLVADMECVVSHSRGAGVGTDGGSGEVHAHGIGIEVSVEFQIGVFACPLVGIEREGKTKATVVGTQGECGLEKRGRFGVALHIVVITCGGDVAARRVDFAFERPLVVRLVDESGINLKSERA